MVKVEGLGKKKTEPRHDTTEPKWNDLIAFDGCTKDISIEVSSTINKRYTFALTYSP